MGYDGLLKWERFGEFCMYSFWTRWWNFNIVAFGKTMVECNHERVILLYVDVRHIESWSRVWRHNGVNFNVLATELRDLIYNQCIDNTCCYSFFTRPTGRIRVCKIRFVSTGENRGKPCLVCKNRFSLLTARLFLILQSHFFLPVLWIFTCLEF